jgi:hypothetical protein
MPYGKEQLTLVHLVHDELHTGVISTGVPIDMLKVVIVAPVVAHLNVIGKELKGIALQSRYATNLTKKLS